MKRSRIYGDVSIFFKLHSLTNLPWGCAKVLISGTVDGIADHVKALFERGTETVKELRRIPDKYGTAEIHPFLKCMCSVWVLF